MSSPVDDLFEDGYALILRLARSRLAKEQSPVSTMTLAHELYIDIRAREDLRFGSREQFLAYVSRAMRSLLIDMARERIAQKRSAELLPLTAGMEIKDGGGTTEQLVMLDRVLTQLGTLDERLLRVAEMRIIMGMPVEQIAASLGVSTATTKREWRRAKAFLFEAFGTALE